MGFHEQERQTGLDFESDDVNILWFKQSDTQILGYVRATISSDKYRYNQALD